MDFNSFAEGNDLFQKVYFKKHEKDFLELAKSGQRPKALFIGCSDSRVIPDLMIQSSPGDLFVVRNVGNFVPPYKADEDYHGTGAAIEYAISVLEVKSVIICGHTDCGACKALYEPINNPALTHIEKWLDLGEKAKSMAVLSLGTDGDKEELFRLTEKLSIVTQIENLMTYPCVKHKLDTDELFIHGWYYDIETGNIDYYDPDKYKFIPIGEILDPI